MMKLARRAKEFSGAPFELLGSTDRREVMKGADFVVSSFSFRNTHYRGTDVRIARKYGVTMCSGDTIGPGGVFRTLRELPEILRIARDIRELASDAWMINFVNPTAALGLGLMRHAPDVKSFALCDDLHDPYKRAEYLFRCGITEKPDLPIAPEHDAKFDLQILGVNHCNFVVKCDYDGVSRMPQLREWVAAQAAKELEVPPRRADSKQHYNYNYALQLFDLYGACPNALGHVKEYVPFFQGFGVSPADPEPIVPFDAFRRADEMTAQWRETEAFADGNLPMADFFARGKGDHATDIIESMWGGLGKRFYVNTGEPRRGFEHGLRCVSRTAFGSGHERTASSSGGSSSVRSSRTDPSGARHARADRGGRGLPATGRSSTVRSPAIRSSTTSATRNESWRNFSKPNATIFPPLGSADPEHTGRPERRPETLITRKEIFL